MSKRSPKPSINGHFELRHWRSTKRKTRPPAIRIPNGDKTSSELSEINPVLNDTDDEGYISLRDILTSPEFADVSSPTVRGGSWPEINISNPLVKQAAYAYLQPNQSAREVERRQLDVKRVISEIFSPCLEFLGVIFNFRR